MNADEDPRIDLPDPFGGEGAAVSGPIDSPDVYARDDEDDDLARTQEAEAAERDERDAALSEQRDDPRDHQAEAEELGFTLAWWAEENDVPVIDTVSDLANSLCGQQQHLELMHKHGYPEDAMSTQVVLNQESGPLVIGALQILGCLHQHLRPAIRKLLVYISENLPVMTEEDQEAWAASVRAVQEEQIEQMKARLEETGVVVIKDTGDLDSEPDDNPEFDPGLS